MAQSSLKDAAISAGLEQVLHYLEKDPETNIPKIMKLIDTVTPKDWYAKQRAAFRKAIDEKSNWYQLIMKVYELDPGVRQALERARAEGFLLAALSDFPISDKLEVLGLEGLFDFVASSEDFGYLKPNEVPFNAMLKALDVRPDEALYVGDSYRKDIVGGARIGMRTMLVSARTGREPHPMADLVLTSWRSFARMVLE